MDWIGHFGLKGMSMAILDTYGASVTIQNHDDDSSQNSNRKSRSISIPNYDSCEYQLNDNTSDNQ